MFVSVTKCTARSRSSAPLALRWRIPRRSGRGVQRQHTNYLLLLIYSRFLVSVPKKKTFSQSYSDCCVEACHEMHTLVRRFIFFTSVLRKPTLFFLRAGLLVQVVRLGRRLRRMIWALEQTSPPRQAQALTALQPHWPQVAAQRKLFKE